MKCSSVRGPAAVLAVALLSVVGTACPIQADETTSDARADVVAVKVRGAVGAYQFLVTLRSPDESCDRYANWWEVLREDGSLAYRRILRHSHPNEQPFARSGGPVPVKSDEVVVVRGHLHPSGYGGVAFRGSVAGGFAGWEDGPVDFAAGLDKKKPLPSGCLH